MTDDAACTWTYADDWDESAWETTCGHSFIIIEGSPKENDMNFCCYCGRPLVAVIAAKTEETP